VRGHSLRNAWRATRSFRHLRAQQLRSREARLGTFAALQPGRELVRLHLLPVDCPGGRRAGRAARGSHALRSRVPQPVRVVDDDRALVRRFRPGRAPHARSGGPAGSAAPRRRRACARGPSPGTGAATTVPGSPPGSTWCAWTPPARCRRGGCCWSASPSTSCSRCGERVRRRPRRLCLSACTGGPSVESGRERFVRGCHRIRTARDTPGDRVVPPTRTRA